MIGDVVEDIRIRHTGRALDDVIEGAFRVLDQFEQVEDSSAEMKRLGLTAPEENAFVTAALALRYGLDQVGEGRAALTAEQVNAPRRVDDAGHSLWDALQRVQENLTKGGLIGRSSSGRQRRTRPVGSIDRSVSLNRGLWVLAEEMRRLKTGEGDHRLPPDGMR